MIKPSVGRVVWYWPPKHQRGDQPWAALIAYVHSDRMVNLAANDSNGLSVGITSVPLLQDDDPEPEGFYCQWVPYQKTAAAINDCLPTAAQPTAK